MCNSLVMALFHVLLALNGALALLQTVALPAAVVLGVLSLGLTAKMAAWTTQAIPIKTPADEHQAWLVQVVHAAAVGRGIAPPAVAVYPGPPNGFIAGTLAGNAILSISTGLLMGRPRKQVLRVVEAEIHSLACGAWLLKAFLIGVAFNFAMFSLFHGIEVMITPWQNVN